MSKIEWTDTTWNPVRGCSLVSAGCESCYAMKQAHRHSGPGRPYEGLTRMTRHGPVWTGEARFIPEKLAEPLSWRTPRMVFVNSMSDLFHDGVTNEQIAAVFGVMAECPRHTFQVLTKRPERMAKWFAWVQSEWDRERESPSYSRQSTQADICMAEAISRDVPVRLRLSTPPWPLSNVWLGVSVEDQKTADKRIPLLLDTPAAVRFVSAEPLLGPVDFSRASLCLGVPLADGTRWLGSKPGLDWAIIGGESGPGARPCNVEWLRSVVRQCQRAQVPVFVKQLGANYVDATNGIGGHQARAPADLGITIRNLQHPKGADPSEWPEDLRVREFPR